MAYLPADCSPWICCNGEREVGRVRRAKAGEERYLQASGFVWLETGTANPSGKLPGVEAATVLRASL